jgi:hypothetical protein
MKKQHVAVVAVLALGTLGLISPAAGAAVALVVDDDGVQCPAATYTSIQAAVNDAVNGDTVQVCAGTYAENVTLAKDITLAGAQAGVDARGRSASESTIAPASGTGILLQTGVAGATIDGFTIQGGTRGVESNTGPLDGLTLANNRVVGFTGNGVFLNDSGIDVTVSQNVVDGTSKTGGGGLFHLDTDNFDGFQLVDNDIVNGATATGFFVDGNHNVGVSAGRDPLIDGNLIQGNTTGMNLGTRAFEFGDITDNTFDGNTFDGLQGGIQNTLIDGNTFSDNGRHGLALTSFGNLGTDRGGQNTDITNNEFTGNGFVNSGEGLFFSSTQFAGTISTNEAHDNTFSGNRRGVGYTGTEVIDVTENWWGQADGPAVSTAGPPTSWAIGSGDAVSQQVEFFPWYTDAGMTTLRACDATATPGVVLVGSNANEVLCGTSADDEIRGRGGNDLLIGNGGRDILNGMGGDDAAIGGGGNDVLRGNAGFDSLQGWAGNDRCLVMGDGGQISTCELT